MSEPDSLSNALRKLNTNAFFLKVILILKAYIVYKDNCFISYFPLKIVFRKLLDTVKTGHK